MLGKNLLLSDVMPDASLLGTPMGNIHVDTLAQSALCMVLILGLGSMAASNMKVAGAGTKGQAVVEGVYNFLDDLAHNNIGHDYKVFFPLIASIFVFVLMGNMIGVFPYQFVEHLSAEHFLPFAWPHITVSGTKEAWEWASPTTDINLTAGLAGVAIITYLGSGFWKHGGHFLKIFLFSPMSWVEWLDLIIRPVTLALRLMVVITADELMRGAFLMLAPFLVPALVMAFELFIGGIQALVFALLTSVYIGLTVAEHH